MCGVCNTTFIHPRNLQVHMRSHRLSRRGQNLAGLRRGVGAAGLAGAPGGRAGVPPSTNVCGDSQGIRKGPGGGNTHTPAPSKAPLCRTIIKCPNCEKTFANRWLVNKHLRNECINYALPDITEYLDKSKFNWDITKSLSGCIVEVSATPLKTTNNERMVMKLVKPSLQEDFVWTA